MSVSVGSVISNRYRMKFSRIVPEVNMNRLTEFNFGIVSYFQAGGRDVISRSIAVLPSSE